MAPAEMTTTVCPAVPSSNVVIVTPDVLVLNKLPAVTEGVASESVNVTNVSLGPENAAAPATVRPAKEGVAVEVTS